ncbi:TldD/PmbA family protein [Romeria aff. gracilis LEGE 07310]|uniref:TldD/PmbA family protein n=1 Tax=Vasconcelosia minhoensis LEGE 07310 TaxID=915328 RepID=A0A8J7A6X3_9CYAN|nr:metallopeptidase TldD-related protein [Romeria gracilis]MBE9077942.1 TldD/PmbA family protein [Romeria aff. gracilis LEGE 07310]
MTQSREDVFRQLAERVIDTVQPAEQFTLTLAGEISQFTRFNQAQVRQTGTVSDGNLRLALICDRRTSTYSLPFTGQLAADWQSLHGAMLDLRAELPQLPADPYIVHPSGNAQSREVDQGSLLAGDAIAPTLLPPVADLTFNGFYAGGLVFRAYADSAGQFHWFETPSFALDYSLLDDRGQAVKGTVAGRSWDQVGYLQKITASKQQLTLLSKPVRAIPRGQYRTYFSPTAVADLMGMFSRGGVGEADLQQGSSALGLLERGEMPLSPKFSLQENFERGGVPRFNSLGEVAPVQLPIIQSGQLVNSLVSARSAKEYGKPSNGAELREGLRAPEVSPGQLALADILPKLDTGLYLSNLHYLNWSDRPRGRVTGMTRYACFWVEAGEIVAPIENLRFDDSLYRYLGETLIELTNVQEFIPKVGTYDQRSLGGIWTPGLLVEDFRYTL